MGAGTGIVAAALALLAFEARAAPARSGVALDYTIFVSGLEALDAEVTITADSAAYDIEIEARTAGIIGVLFPWVIRIASTGNIEGDRLQPLLHRQTSNFRGKDRSVYLDYDGHGGFLERRVVPGAHEDDRDQVPQAMTRDTLDIVSAVLAGLRTVARTGSCNGRVPVYDGRRRFDLVYSDDGRERLSDPDIDLYQSDAVRCAIRVEPVAGFWRKSQKSFFTRRVNGKDRVVPIEVDVARVGTAGIEVPVRVESTSRFGRLILDLEHVRDSPAMPAR